MEEDMITLVEAETEREYEEWCKKADMEYSRLMKIGMNICENYIKKPGDKRAVRPDNGETEENEIENLEMEEKKTAIMSALERLEQENSTLKGEKNEMMEQHKWEIEELNEKITLMDLQKEELREMMEAKSWHEEGEMESMEQNEGKIKKMKDKILELEIRAQANDELIKSIQQALLEKSKESRAIINAYEKEKLKCEILKEEINEITTMAKNMAETTKRTNRIKQFSNEQLLNDCREPMTLRRTTSILSSSTEKSHETDRQADKLIMMMDANEDIMARGRRFMSTPTESITWEQAEKKAKRIKWPTFDGTITSKTYLRLFIIQIESAKEKMIPDEIIRDSIIQHLMSSKYMAQFANLTQELSPKTLENVIKILERLDPEEQCMSGDERFRAMKMMKDESAITYVKRLQTAYRDIFGQGTVGETRRIRNQFIEGYTSEGIRLDKEERRNLYVCNDLVDLAIAADRAALRQKKEKEKRENKKAKARTPTPPLQKPWNQNKENTSNQRFQEIFGNRNQKQGSKQTNPTNNQWRTSPGIYAKRASLAEIVEGKSLNGTPVCQSCAQEGHNSSQCKYWEYCKICSGEFRHNSIWHLKKMNREKIANGNQNHQQANMPPIGRDSNNHQNKWQNKE